MSIELISVEVTNFGAKLRFTPEDLLMQWDRVFTQIARRNFTSFEEGLVNYQYPNGLPNLTRKLKAKSHINTNENFFIDEYGDRVNMYWIMETDEGNFYFTTNIVYCPSNDIYKFD